MLAVLDMCATPSPDPQGSALYPFARIVCYHADATGTARLVVCIFFADNTVPLHKEWLGPSILNDSAVWAEQQHFLDRHKVQTVTICLKDQQAPAVREVTDILAD